ncbi:dual specificity protein phosphatase 1-like isoform X1 [Actinidia eriantha]|uniref:dual specificity protein phosphatase 1-like isoform X1 n=1 Tax=Actinidia eriantha TaxID=165200 RepID=UPI00258632FF|nr:dual specificity protein phosphatase 1-like isoform X1 [Actinidia eriantha]
MDRNADILRERVEALQRAMKVIRAIKDDNVPCQIEKDLYLGSLEAANNKSALKSLNVTHILSVTDTLPLAHQNDFVYKTIDIPDRLEVNIAQYFDECFNFIEEAKRVGGGVLVHCVVGKSRSATIVVAYLMKKHRMSVSKALKLVRSKRPIASPQLWFYVTASKL